MRIAILTGGGDVAPLNAVIHAAIETCRNREIELIGYLNGWDGLLNDHWVRLNDLKLNPSIGGTILKSSRINLKKVDKGPEIVLNNLKKNRIDGLIVIGGEDTLSNALYLKDFPKILISKTIDNDVGRHNKGEFLNYFTLGYPTAAAKIASFVSLAEGMRTTAWSHERILVVESMGMHAGWLAFASAQGHPDFIVIPEFPLDYNQLEDRVIVRYKENKNVIIVISEGARWSNGQYISADENERDSFGHPRFRGTAEILTKKLKEGLKKHFDTRNINAVNPSYLYRSGTPGKLDFEMAIKMGMEAVNILADQEHKTTSFLCSSLDHNEFGIENYNFNELNDIEEFHRFVDRTIYDPDEYTITTAGRDYLSKIVSSFPSFDYEF